MDTTLPHEAVTRFERIEKFISDAIHHSGEEDAERQEGEAPVDHIDRIVNPKPEPDGNTVVTAADTPEVADLKRRLAEAEAKNAAQEVVVPEEHEESEA